eukprot:CAMPEP_0114260642 /NCGR_PEP_ID=MMETSP0058-20121206/20615_1 /TAXON_ID=36894 /ORGANISM="Pyramimonas parkeae, CCMP726" /LENGTH=322 /DNA_ID=CAMNT_0001375929 /DNA_START=9 /DNA_END=977 /DNA_ORIENTATION=-
MRRVSGSILHTAVETGRLAMEEPNLQCVPKPVAYLMPELNTPGSQSQAVGETTYMNVRKAFRASPGFVLMSVDYSQLELRLMAHFSGDAGLCSMLALEGPDGDPFRQLAATWHNVPPQSVNTDQRNWAKQLAYGLLYGKGPASFAQDLDCDIPTATAAMEDFRRALPGVDGWLKRVVQECAERRPPHVLTLLGRRRYLNDVKLDPKTHFQRVAAAQRRAVNTVCQGSAADIAKLAMNRVYHCLKELQSRATTKAGIGEPPRVCCKLLVQIHDELLFEVAYDSLPTIASLVKESMECVVKLRVPLLVKVQTGPSWGELVPYEF